MGERSAGVGRREFLAVAGAAAAFAESHAAAAESQGWTETAVRIRLLRARRSVGKRLGRRTAEAPPALVAKEQAVA